MDTELWAVEYSQSQGFFQFGTLADVVKYNRQAVAGGSQRDYLLIHICRSLDECSEFAKKWHDAGYCHNFNPLNYVELV